MIQVNGTELKLGTFPNGETLVDGDELLKVMKQENVIIWKYENDGDLIKLMFVKQYIEQHQATAALIIAYMPYSRMDRIEGTSAFTLKYTANFINSLQFSKVTVIEPHSDVTLALLDRSEALYPTIRLIDQVAEAAGLNWNHDVLFFPDAGAQKRYSKLKGDYKQLVGFKQRDFATGRIQSLELVGQVPTTPFKALIVDDLCSYGGTFLLSAEKLKQAGASHVYLLVAHCEKSIYKGKLLDSGLVDRVFTTDTMLDEAGHDNIHIFELGGFIHE
jgi:ribose-phosphate pyrophosphokinase